MRGESHPLFGKPRSEETKKKIREALLGEKSPKFGTKSSKETRDKLSASKMGDKNPQFGKQPWNSGLKLEPQSEERKAHMHNRGRSRVVSGTHNLANLVCVDGITDSITSTCFRIGMERHYFSKLMKDGHSPQEIADKSRITPSVSGRSLF